MNIFTLYKRPVLKLAKIIPSDFYFLSEFRSNIKNYSTSNQEKSQTQIEDQLKFKKKLLLGPSLKHFFKNDNLKTDWNPSLEDLQVHPFIDDADLSGKGKKVYFEVYGCQMNVSDTEVIWSILKSHDYEKTETFKEADIVLLVTCAIRDGAETKIWNKLELLKGLKKKRPKSRPPLKIGIVGCMAERLKEKVLEKEKSVDVVVGPDAYRDLPRLLAYTDSGYKSVNVMLSLEETYADITPVRLNENGVTAFVSIMRGCDNMCTYCIVPWTRGRERSRPITSILKEVESLASQGVKEVTLLGQNVNSYRDASETDNSETALAQPTALTRGFKTVYKSKMGGLRFSHLLEKVARIDPNLRVRFTSPHPKDFPDDLLKVIAEYPNVCKSLHLPAQSGNTAVLERMRRGYTREAYLELIKHVRTILPDVSLSSDFICGFCGETEEEFVDTLTLMDEVKFNVAYTFAYSMREKTAAHRRFQDDVPANVKQERLKRMMKIFRYHAEKLNRAQIGKTHLVLIEGFSKRSSRNFAGRSDGNVKVIVSGSEEKVPAKDDSNDVRTLKPGDYVAVYINEANSQVLKGIPLFRTAINDFYFSENDPTHYGTEREMIL